MSKIKVIEPPPYHNVADTLVGIAKQITQGELDNVASAVVVLRNADNSVYVYGLGPSNADTTIATMVLGIDKIKEILKKLGEGVQ